MNPKVITKTLLESKGFIIRTTMPEGIIILSVGDQVLGAGKSEAEAWANAVAVSVERLSTVCNSLKILNEQASKQKDILMRLNNVLSTEATSN